VKPETIEVSTSAIIVPRRSPIICLSVEDRDARSVPLSDAGEGAGRRENGREVAPGAGGDGRETEEEEEEEEEDEESAAGCGDGRGMIPDAGGVDVEDSIPGAGDAGKGEDARGDRAGPPGDRVGGCGDRGVRDGGAEELMRPSRRRRRG
jgi:hypothetical protein